MSETQHFFAFIFLVSACLLMLFMCVEYGTPYVQREVWRNRDGSTSVWFTVWRRGWFSSFLVNAYRSEMDAELHAREILHERRKL